MQIDADPVDPAYHFDEDLYPDLTYDFDADQDTTF